MRGGGGGRGVVSYVFGFSRRVALRYSLKYNVLSMIIWIALLISMFYYTLAMRNFIDYLVSFSRVSVGSWLAGVLRYALVLLGLWGSTYVLNTFGEYALQLAKLATLRGLASEFVKRISLAKPDVVPERGDVVGRFMSDLNQVSQLGAFPASLGIQVARVVVGFVLLYVLSPQLLLVALALLPVYYVVTRFSSERLARVSQFERQAFAQLSTSFRELVEGLLHAKTFPSLRSYLTSVMDRRLGDWRARLRSFFFYDVFFKQSFHGLYRLVRLVILIAGGFFVVEGLTSIGSVIAFSSAVYNLLEPVTNLSYTFAALSKFHPYVKRVEEVLNLEPEKDEGEELERVDSIELDDVVIDVSGRRLLSGVSMRVERGRVYAVMGPTGSGKTTLLLTIIRFREPVEGEVRINGVDYRRFRVSSIRSRVVYLPQAPLILKASLWENVALGAPIRREKIEKALRIAKVDFVHDLDEELDPQRLSDGQKQRIALARALILEPDVLLLDEALNAVDERTEAEIMEELRREIERGELGAVVVVTHRASTLKYVDHVYVLERGKLVREGAPNQILPPQTNEINT